MQLEALRELDALQVSETQRQPWLGKRLGDADGKLLAPKKETIALEVIPVERKLLPPKRDELRSDERHRGMLRRQHELCVPGLGHRA